MLLLANCGVLPGAQELPIISVTIEAFLVVWINAWHFSLGTKCGFQSQISHLCVILVTWGWRSAKDNN